MRRLNGQVEILRYLDISSWTTLRRWRRLGLPVYTTPTGQLFAVCEELKAWRRLPRLPGYRKGGEQDPRRGQEVDAWSDFLKRATATKPARKTGLGA